MCELTLRMEDATRYLPHNPIGREYTWFVDKGFKSNPYSNKLAPNVVFSGTKSECEAFVERLTK